MESLVPDEGQRVLGAIQQHLIACGADRGGVREILDNPRLTKFWSGVVAAYTARHPAGSRDDFQRFLYRICLILSWRLNHRAGHAEARRKYRDAAKKVRAAIEALNSKAPTVAPIDVQHLFSHVPDRDHPGESCSPVCFSGAGLSVSQVLTQLAELLERSPGGGALDKFSEGYDLPQPGRRGWRRLFVERNLANEFQQWLGSPRDDLIHEAVGVLLVPRVDGDPAAIAARRRSRRSKKKKARKVK